VFEIFRKQVTSKDGRVPNNKRGSIFVPRNNLVDRFIFDKVICFCQKRRRNRSLRLKGGCCNGGCGCFSVVFHRSWRRSHEEERILLRYCGGSRRFGGE